MTPERLSKLASGPAAFRDALLVRTRKGLAALGAVLADFQRDMLAPLDEAVTALAAGREPEYPRQFVVMSKGSAKTTLIAVDLLWLIIFSRQPVEGRIGAGDLEQAAEARKVIKDLVRDNPWLGKLVEVLATEIRCKRGDNRLVLETMASKTAHGGRPLVTWVDEFVHVPGEGGEEFVDALLANQAKLGGLTIISSNAGTFDSWQHKRFLIYSASPDWKTTPYNRPAPWITERDIAAMGLPEPRVRRLFWGDWQSAGDALSHSDIEASITLDGPMFTRDIDYTYFFGVDLGISRDHAACVLVGRHRASLRLRLCGVNAWEPKDGNKVDLPFIRNWLIMHSRLFHALVLLDPFQAELMAQDVELAGCKTQMVPFGTASKQAMAGALLQAFNSRMIDLYRWEPLLADLRRLKLVDRPIGYTLEANRTATGGHADRAIALSIALHGAWDVKSRLANLMGAGEEGAPRKPGEGWIDVEQVRNGDPMHPTLTQTLQQTLTARMHNRVPFAGKFG